IVEDEIVLGALEKCALRVHDRDAGDDGADVAEFSAGVHAHAPADGAGNAGETFDAGETLADRADEELLHVHAGAGFEHVSIVAHAAEMFLVEAEDCAIDAGVTDEKIGAETENIYGNVVLR